jgi:hypothetical protein
MISRGLEKLVSDIFNEIDEEVRRDQIKKFWDRYQNYIIAGAVLIVLLVAGWRLYHWWEAKRAAEAGTEFQIAMALSAEGRQAEAEAAFSKIGESGAQGYRDFSRLQAAAELAQRDPKAAVVAYDALADDTRMREPLRDLAALRAAYLLVDSEPYEHMRQRLQPLTAEGRTFRNSARELLALAASRNGDMAAARVWFDGIMADGEATPAMRQRVEMLIASATNGKS